MVQKSKKTFKIAVDPKKIGLFASGLTLGEVSMIQALRFFSVDWGLSFEEHIGQWQSVELFLAATMVLSHVESLRLILYSAMMTKFSTFWSVSLEFVWSSAASKPRCNSFSTVKRFWFHHIFLVQERSISIFRRMTGLKLMFAILICETYSLSSQCTK